MGVQLSWVTLHVGLGTFNPIKTEWATDHRMHEERYEISEDTMRAIQAAKKAGRKVIAVGTTTSSGPGIGRFHLVDRSEAGSADQAEDRYFYLPTLSIRTDRWINHQLSLTSEQPHDAGFSIQLSWKPGGHPDSQGPLRRSRQERYRFFSFGDAMMIL